MPAHPRASGNVGTAFGTGFRGIRVRAVASENPEEEKTAQETVTRNDQPGTVQRAMSFASPNGQQPEEHARAQRVVALGGFCGDLTARAPLGSRPGQKRRGGKSVSPPEFFRRWAEEGFKPWLEAALHLWRAGSSVLRFEAHPCMEEVHKMCLEFGEENALTVCAKHFTWDYVCYLKKLEEENDVNCFILAPDGFEDFTPDFV